MEESTKKIEESHDFEFELHFKGTVKGKAPPFFTEEQEAGLQSEFYDLAESLFKKHGVELTIWRGDEIDQT